ncbi:unnamed protein product [Ceutorhynchus assimilis]|uniref:Uncharacterized protein n=1 Tax=Ceutorhynchus assimilis TaxID=467358 RepID=A0A9N9MVL5_9CUCU|nr:unnamed protein product [Ceutorhynchus assimilis]
MISNKERNIGDSHSEGSIDNELKHMKENIRTKLLDALKKAHNLKKRTRLKKINVNRTTLKRTSLADKVLGIIIKERREWTLSEFNELIYTAASVVAGENERKSPYRSNLCEPRWKIRIRKCIESYRSELAILYEFKNDVPTRKVLSKVDGICKKYKIDETIEELELKVKMKLLDKSQRLRRYSKRADHYYQNKIFNEDPKKFY